jgi:polyribonucleotide nucleotidyltransferase
MDFKVAGTETGITALQMDIKVEGITKEIMAEALQAAEGARLFILDKIKEVIAEPRPEIAETAPHIEVLKINPVKIGDIIGPQGKIIKSIIEATGAVINIEDDGTIQIASPDESSINAAKERILELVAEPEIGKEYLGVVTTVRDFGAFVEFMPHYEGLVHISNLEHNRTSKVEDVVKVGDKVYVKVIAIDKDGKVQLSIKDAKGNKFQKPRQDYNTNKHPHKHSYTKK